MHQQINKWIHFFQGLIYTQFRQNQQEAIEVLTWLIVGHLFGLFNPNQFAEALGIDTSHLYSHLANWSLDQWKRFLVQVGCHQAAERIREAESMSDSTRSRRNITSSVDDTVCDRNGKVLSYCYHWYSGRFHAVINGQNIIAITLKIGSVILPLAVRLVGKQGRANTQKPQILREMLEHVEAVFASYGISLTNYPISFDSWYGSQPLREQLEEMGFDSIVIHAKSNYVFEIDGKKAKLSDHKKTIDLQDHQWGCDGPVHRKEAQSPTFGKVVLLFFLDGNQKRCVMAFGRRLRGAEILRIWHQHHAIEQFWRCLKSIVGLKSMRLHGREGAYAGLAVKVLAYLLLADVSAATGLTFHQIILYLSGQRTFFFEIFEHFHEPNQTFA